MSVGEGTSFYVLTGESNVDSFFQEGSISHGFGQSPIDSAIFHHFHTRFQDSGHGFVNDKVISIGRSGAEAFANVSQSLFMDTDFTSFEGILALEKSGPWAVQPMLVINLFLS